MFEITPDDIALLDDEDLRTLIGRLCEAEMTRRGFSPSAVMWGGHQNAADGGLDVRVTLPSGTLIDGFVPRAATGFQVKKEDMPRAKIHTEVCKDGVLRPVIRELADQSGAYIIVSSAGSTSDVALRKRREAMAEAVKDLPNANFLTLDFYDRTRIATWVRDHAGLILWMREKIGKASRGWQAYGAWACPQEGVDGEYLLDNELRLRTDKNDEGNEIPIVQGITRIRELLRNPRSVARLVGLSGFGKTRLVQALFDKRVAEQNLDPTLAFYANIADDPDPQPVALISDLIATRKRAILVVDNCTPELNRRLTEVCRSPESLVSVITIEYDIREDEPEGTEVFRLESSSIELIQKLITHRFPTVSFVDSRTIAEFSGGNARIATVLAGTIDKNETIKGLNDEELFQRLFRQLHEDDQPLLLAAEVLSLVYSFQGEDDSENDQAELFRFGALIGSSPQEMFRFVADLRSRDLIQRRGKWRAVLPHAIANRLAVKALQNIPFSKIESLLLNNAPERLVRSFSRRLGYLDSSEEAKAIVRRWLRVDGLLGSPSDLDELGRAMFHNIAPVIPESVLAALEHGLLEAQDAVVLRYERYVPLLRSLAYDSALFERSVRLIVKIAEAGNVNDDKNETAKILASLFMIHLSGTHATIEQRLEVIRSWLLSDDPKRCGLGLMALRAALETHDFGVGYNFEFGARSRDYGYWPRTRDEVKHWFGQALRVAETLACSDDPSASQVRILLAGQFRGLWTGSTAHDDLERVCRAISADRFWTEGWIAVRETLHYDSGGFSPEISARLSSLEVLLRPRDLVQKVRSMVLSETVIYVGLDSTYDGTNDVDKTLEQVEIMARTLGKAVAVDKDAFGKLLPDLIAGKSQQLWNFGGDLAEGSQEPRATWSQLVTNLAATATDKRNPHVFCGFLKSLHAAEPELVNALLDDALENEVLAQWYPVLQTAVGIDKEGVNRLIRSLELEKAWIGIYRSLVGGGVTHQINGRDFNNLLLRIAGKPGGLDIAIEILFMRLSFDKEGHSSTSEIISLGCELMRQLRFDEKRGVGLEHRLGIVARRCLVGEQGAATVREICHNLKEAVSKSETYPFYQKELLLALVDAQPIESLKALCGDNALDLRTGMSILDQAGQLRRNAFDAVPDAELLSWCDQQPETRYPAVAAGLTVFQASAETGGLKWTSTAHTVLDKAPNRVEVLKKFIGQLSPMSWVGSHAAIVESNAKLLDELAEYPDPVVRQFIAKEKTRLAEAIKIERQTETLIDRDRNERFE